MQLELANPNNSSTDALLEWYFEKYISMPYDDVKVSDAVDTIEKYGKDLFELLFTKDPNISFPYRTALQNIGPENITIEIIGDSPAFQGIYWESLLEPGQAFPLAAQGVAFVRRSVKYTKVRSIVKASPILNLLIVTARPGEESDVDYRTIQRPLIELIEETETPVKAHILRPGTYEALIRHLDQKAGFYHLIHFDLHGSLLDYAAYKQYQDSVERVPLSNAIYKGSYGLKELKEEVFNNGKKAFIFFESEEKGTAIPVDAEQLADMLEHKQIPICILNACQSAKQDNSAHETSLGRVLVQKGIQLVLAMRYSVSVTAAKVMMEMLYRQLYQKKPIEQAIAISRKELYRLKERKAVFNYTIELEDWLLPVVYQNGKPNLNLRKFTPEEEEEFVTKQQLPEEVRDELSYGFFGRDLDILKIEKNLLMRSNILLLQGMGGAGKTSLLKYLSGWWLRTGFVQGVFYFGYEVKAYTLNEMLYYIAQKIYPKPGYASFTALSPAVQENRILKELKANSFALILDNAESITGENLSIPHTLAEEERKALKNFIRQLKGGQSPVIIGSRSSEEWLKTGTFDSNCYLLPGLDPESASNFAHRILQDIEIPVKAVINDEHFKRLMKLLAGYPLALKAILPNLKRKTAKGILKELKEGVGDLDKGNVQEKTTSIIKCIEYAHSNLSEEAQQLLLCLAPFQSGVNIEPKFIKIYFEELRKEEHLQSYPFDKLDAVVQEAVQNGFMQKALPNQSSKLMTLQPVFTYFLKNKFQAQSTSIQQQLQFAYIRYYRDVSSILHQYLISNEPQLQQVGLILTGFEYENLYQILNITLDQQESILEFYIIIKAFLDKKQLFQKGLQITEMVHEKMQEYNHQKLEGKIAFDLLEVKMGLADTFQVLKKYRNAQEEYSKVLDLLNINPYLIGNKDLRHYKGLVFQNLGVVSKEKQDYPAAIIYYEKALKIFKRFNLEHYQGQVYQNLGQTSYEQKVYPAAKKYSEKALEIFKKHQDVHSQGQVYLNLGAISEDQKDYPAAKEYFQEALNTFKKYQDFHGQGRIYYNLGLVSYHEKFYTEAKIYLEKALEIYVQYQDFHGQGKVYHNLGVVADMLGDNSAAKGYFQKSIEVFDNFQDLVRMGQACYNLGLVAYKQKDYLSAKDYYQKALDIFQKLPKDSDYSLRLVGVIKNIYKLVMVTKDRDLGKNTIQNVISKLDGEEKLFLNKLLAEINNLK